MRIYIAAIMLVAGYFSAVSAPFANTVFKRDINTRSLKSDLVIKNDSGGYIVTYAMAVERLARSDKRVRIAGRCDSACTMYLGLPRARLCVERGAYFRFHKPSAGSAQTVVAATRFLMRKYPSWVTEWISANGGLTGTLKTMDFQYASRYLPVCQNTA